MRLGNIISFFILLSLSSLSSANNLATISSHHCARLKGNNRPFILVLKKGEEIIEGINRCAQDAKLSGATITGIGALENPTLNFYNLQTKRYQDRVFDGLYELISVSGNISQVNGKRESHLHVAISNDKFHILGGHLSKGVVGVTAEINIFPLKGKVVKREDPVTGIALIKA